MRIGDQWVSLNALNTFEAAARHGHMGRAAGELHVTQSAISHQVKGLEETLGIALFERRGRRLQITPAGTLLMRAIQEGFDGISATALAIQRDEFSQQLTIMAPVSLMAEWLTPKLSMFLEMYPSLTLDCRIAERNQATIPPEVDLAITFESFKLEGRRVSPLLPIRVFPVCSPRLVTGLLPLDPAVLRDGSLIHEDDGTAWRRWFAARGVEPVTPRRQIHAGSLHDAMAFARGGAGFAITDWFLGQNDIAAGTLVQPFGPDTVETSHYYLAMRRDEPEGSPAGELARWLKREIGGSLG